MRRSFAIASVAVLVIGLAVAYIAHHPALIFPEELAPLELPKDRAVRPPRPPRPKQAPGPAPPAVIPEWRYNVVPGQLRDLGQAVADRTARELGRLHGVQAEAAPHGDVWGTYRVAWGAGDVEVLLVGDPWAADPWMVAAKAMRRKDAAPVAQADTTDTARELLTPTTPTLLRLDRVLGESLERDPQDAAAHERAALLAAVVAYRETAGPFTDRRECLSIACAHLATARACGAGGGTSGRVAEALIRCLAGLETETLALLAAWPADDPVLAPWGRAIRLRAGLDWFADGAGQDATLVERLAHIRALAERVGASAALAWAGEAKPAMPDWTRLACEGSRISVEAGHVCTLGGLRDEIIETLQVLAGVQGRAAKIEDLAKLCASVDDKPVARVVSAGGWARWSARQLTARLDQCHHFAEHSWGVHERAVEIRALAGHSLAGMPLLDMLRCAWPEASEHQAARNAVGEMMRTHPEQAPPGLWTLLNKKGDGPYAGNWFHRSDKPDMQWCAEDAGYGRRAWNDEAQLRGILAQSPRQPWASRMLVRLLLTQNRHDLAKPIIDDLGRIDYSVVWWASSTLTGDQRLPYLQMLARLDAGAFIELGDQLVAAKREVEAADAYEQAFREAPDRVEVANSMGWWVDWLLKRGQTDRAREVADHGREVFSYTGLCIWSSFCERTGDLNGAEKALLDLDERYEDRNELRAFWQRTRTIRVASAQAIEREEKRVFPAGRTSANLNDFTGPPPPDIVLNGVGGTLSKAGVIKGQAVVAVDGTRCATCAQLDYLLSVHQDGPLRLIVWDGKAYAERIAGK